MKNSFGITLSEMLDIDIFKDAKVLAGKKGIINRVTKVNVMEVPDIEDWVTTGEFLLTTAYSIKDDISKLEGLIKRLNQKGLAGIGIKTKRYVNEIPQNIIDTANEIGFPIIEIPINISHTDIITPVLTEIVNSQTNILIQIDNFHRRLIDVMLHGGSLTEIAKAMHESIDNTVAIYDEIFQSYTIYGNKEIKSSIAEILEKEQDKTIVSTTMKSNKELKKYIDKIDNKSIPRIVIPIFNDDKLYGYVYIWEDERMISPVELTVIESSTPIIALDLVKKLSIFEIENKNKIEFFDDLLSDDENRQRKALDKGNYFGFDKRKTYSVIVVAIKDIDRLVRLTPSNANYVHQINIKLINIVDRLSRYSEQKVIFANKSDRLIIVFGMNREIKTNVMKRNVLEFSNQIFKYVKREGVEENISIGIGRSYSDLGLLWKSYREAYRAAESLKDNKGAPAHYDDLGIYRILSFEELKPELNQFYKEVLEPLVRYDNEKDSELVKTLQMYFECGGNLKRISEEMFTHYNTIIYRMQRIKDITDINMDNASDRLNIQIALKIYEVYANIL